MALCFYDFLNNTLSKRPEQIIWRHKKTDKILDFAFTIVIRHKPNTNDSSSFFSNDGTIRIRSYTRN